MLFNSAENVKSSTGATELPKIIFKIPN